MNKREYQDEINLITKQNNVEVELYPLVAEIISSTLTGLSKRYVFARRRSALGRIYYGISSFPDIAIVDRAFNNQCNEQITEDNWNKLRGCVEVKSYNSELYHLEELKQYSQGKQELSEEKLREVGQLIGEILWYKKVLYTNGVEWILFEFNDPNGEYTGNILSLAQKQVRGEVIGDYWWREPVILSAFSKITEKIISKNCINDWGKFIANIEEINWINDNVSHSCCP